MNVTHPYWAAPTYPHGTASSWGGYSGCWPQMTNAYPPDGYGGAGYSQYPGFQTQAGRQSAANTPGKTHGRALTPNPSDLLKLLDVAEPTVYPAVTQPLTDSAKHAGHSHDAKAITPTARMGNLLAFGGLILAALLLHNPKLPVHNKFKLISSDWKDWARIFLGVAAVSKLNKALDWSPPPWLGGIEAVALIAPLALGFNLDSLKQLAVMAPMVAGVVQGASTINDSVTEPLEKQYNVPAIVTRLGISVVMAGIGLALYPRVFRHVARTGILGKEIQKNAEKAALGIGTIVCSRGCCTSLICMSEIGEMAGAFANWFKSDRARQSALGGRRQA